MNKSLLPWVLAPPVIALLLGAWLISEANHRPPPSPLEVRWPPLP